MCIEDFYALGGVLVLGQVLYLSDKLTLQLTRLRRGAVPAPERTMLSLVGSPHPPAACRAGCRISESRHNASLEREALVRARSAVLLPLFWAHVLRTGACARRLRLPRNGRRARVTSHAACVAPATRPAGPCRAAQSVFYAGMRDSMTLRRARFFSDAGGGQTSPTPPPRRLSSRPGCGSALRVGFVASDGGIDVSAFCFRRRHPSRRHCRVVRLLSVGRESLVGGSVRARYGRGASAGPGAICRIGGRR